MLTEDLEVAEDDIDTTGYYNRDGGTGNGADPFPALPALSGREAHAQIHTVSRKSTAFGGIWTAGGVLPEECQPVFGQPWDTGVYFDRGSGSASSVEAADADIHSGRDCLLHAAGTIGILIQFLYPGDGVRDWD